MDIDRQCDLNTAQGPNRLGTPHSFFSINSFNAPKIKRGLRSLTGLAFALFFALVLTACGEGGTAGEGGTIPGNTETPGTDGTSDTAGKDGTTDTAATGGTTESPGPDVGVQQHVFRLPDTGQTNGITETYGEDADYKGNQPSYTDNSDDTVTDNNTGLMWEKLPAVIIKSHADALSACQNRSTGGHKDWRLPEIFELQTIIDYGKSANAKIDTGFFPNTASSGYWSSSLYYGGSVQAWFVSFSDGISHFDVLSSLNYVRCVRGDVTPTTLTDNNDTVTDQKTGLIWQKDIDGTNRNWEDALAYCEGLTLAEQTDWRLPNIRELASILDYKRFYPTFNPIFPSIITWIWSSTPSATDSNKAWLVGTNNGFVNSYVRTLGISVRCVRSGK